MSKSISYRDIIVLPGEDTQFVMSILFSSIHGCQRRRCVNEMVVVPILVHEGDVFVWGKDGRLPNGFRVFAAFPETLNFDVSPRIDDAVKIKKTKTITIDGETKFLLVDRARDRDASYFRRLAKRGNLKVESLPDKKLSVKKDKFILLEKNGKRCPVFFRFDFLEKDACLAVKNSYGFGLAPFIDFSQ